MSGLVYDCFMFFNELDLLEIRLNVLSEVVDKFVLVEANKTFTNKDKPFFFEENKERYKAFIDKIIHIKIEDYNFEPFTEVEYPIPLVKPNMSQKEYHSAWNMEHYQRNQISRGLVHCSLDDVILISDLDEIPNPKAITHYKENGSGIYHMEQLLFYYYLNYQKGIPKYLYAAKITRYKEIVDNHYTPQNIRNYRSAKKLKHGGWHFTYLGGVEAIKYKLRSYSHQEFNNDRYINDKIETKIHKGLNLFDQIGIRFIPVKITSKSHPEYIFDNIKKYSHLIYPHINYYIIIKNTIICFIVFFFALPKKLITKIAKFILPKTIVDKIKNRNLRKRENRVFLNT
jgi:beta-1,4-mannosyl-glycoprotein beta-1,4-N-acetylglucosaminyltransferase